VLRSTKSLLVVVCAIALLLIECAPKPKPPLVLLYQSRKEALEGLDLSSLEGRTIVIDPGHGGVFRGALGPAGLDEADVNLGVALYLWGLLAEAGAEVELTRKTDRDFVGGDSLRLSDDLHSRVEVVDRIRPDIFISLHHNSGLAVDTTFNEIQIYFKMQDRGPSLDLARIVARHLRMNLGETATRVLPGNYHVLRNSPVPAILCEPSYISNTQVESRLKLADKQRLEAEVYFIALADYFSRGIPQVKDFTPRDTQRTGTPLIEIAFDLSALIDASTVVMSLDGENLEPFRLGLNSFGALPLRPLRSGRHSIEARARSIQGNSSPEAAWTFLVRTEPAVLDLSTRPAKAHPVFPQAIEALVLDGNGNPAVRRFAQHTMAVRQPM
jgi:N-acetylmuramoyl-L-alanine amidase